MINLISADDIEYYYRTLLTVAKGSPDTSSQNAALIVDRVNGNVVSACSNHFPRDVSPRLDRPEKYSFIEHAERNAVFAAAKSGIATDGLTMVALWASCADCARSIIQSGISSLYRHSFYSNYSGPSGFSRMAWAESIEHGDLMMREAGVEIVEYDLFLDEETLLFNGEEYRF